jgi:hypothetical protein
MKLKKTNFLLFLSEGKHWCIPPPLGVLLYNCHYCIVDCAYTLYELIEALECITTLCISLDPIVVENSLVVLRLVDITLVKDEWQVPLTRLGLFILWFMNGMD